MASIWGKLEEASALMMAWNKAVWPPPSPFPATLRGKGYFCLCVCVCVCVCVLTR